MIGFQLLFARNFRYQRRYLARHREPYEPGVRWRRRQPIAKIGYSIFMYNLTDDPEGLMNSTKLTSKQELACHLNSCWIRCLFSATFASSTKIACDRDWLSIFS
jgi:hypothetical protein